jgi:hypothetical protein
MTQMIAKAFERSLFCPGRDGGRRRGVAPESVVREVAEASRHSAGSFDHLRVVLMKPLIASVGPSVALPPLLAGRQVFSTSGEEPVRRFAVGVRDSCPA